MMGTMDDATWIIYRGMGSPEPHETNGEPIPKKGTGGRCAHCGRPAWYRLNQAISSSFSTVKNGSRAWPFATNEVCEACLMACKSLRLRCALWFARESGVWHVPTRPWIVKDAAGKGHALPGTRVETLDSLLYPPPVPFVAGWPRMGIAKGGEQNIHRVYSPGRVMPQDPLVKIQSKHVAIYAQVATSRDRYPLQVDDVHDVIVDVEEWSVARDAAYVLLRELRGDGIGQQDCLSALLTMRAPPGASIGVMRQWRDMIRPIERHHTAIWWPLFVELLRMPELVKREKQDPKEGKRHAATDERTGPEEHREEHHQRAPSAVLPAALNKAADARRGSGVAQVQLRLF